MSSNMQDFLPVLVDLGDWNKTPYHKLIGLYTKEIISHSFKIWHALKASTHFVFGVHLFPDHKEVSLHVGKQYNSGSIQKIL